MKVINFEERMHDACEKWNNAEERILRNTAEYSRYNGGWVKKISGLDKSVQNGYSLLGDFVDVGDFESNVADGLYIDCSIDGSRRNQERSYHLVKVIDGEIEIIEALHDAGRKYAVHFWSFIEKELAENAENIEYDVSELLAKVKKLEHDLKVVNYNYTVLQEDLKDANERLSVCEEFVIGIGADSGVDVDVEGNKKYWIEFGDVCVRH